MSDQRSQLDRLTHQWPTTSSPHADNHVWVWLIFLGIMGAIVVTIALQKPPTQADRAAEGACLEIDAADAASSNTAATPAERDVAYQLRVGSAAGAAWLHAEMEDQAAITGMGGEEPRVGPVFRSVSGSCGQDYPELMTAYRSFRGWEQSG